MFSADIICIGRLKDAFFEAASDEYLKRLKAYAKVRVTEIKAAALPENPSEGEIHAALEKEGTEILKRLSDRASVISLCIEGKQLSSEGFAELLDDISLHGNARAIFVIGGSHGLADSIKRASDIKLSMSEMTFPHRLARVMLLEQLYRAFRIINNEKYHK